MKASIRYCLLQAPVYHTMDVFNSLRGQLLLPVLICVVDFKQSKFQRRSACFATECFKGMLLQRFRLLQEMLIAFSKPFFNGLGIEGKLVSVSFAKTAEKALKPLYFFFPVFFSDIVRAVRDLVEKPFGDSAKRQSFTFRNWHFTEFEDPAVHIQNTMQSS